MDIGKTSFHQAQPQNKISKKWRPGWSTLATVDLLIWEIFCVDHNSGTHQYVTIWISHDHFIHEYIPRWNTVYFLQKQTGNKVPKSQKSIWLFHTEYIVISQQEQIKPPLSIKEYNEQPMHTITNDTHIYHNVIEDTRNGTRWKHQEANEENEREKQINLDIRLVRELKSRYYSRKSKCCECKEGHTNWSCRCICKQVIWPCSHSISEWSRRWCCRYQQVCHNLHFLFSYTYNPHIISSNVHKIYVLLNYPQWRPSDLSNPRPKEDVQHLYPMHGLNWQIWNPLWLY